MPYKDGIQNINMNTLKNNLHEDARSGIIAGINKMSRMIAPTLGASGSNCIIEEDMTPGYRITNDGYLILENSQFEDPLEELGRKVLFDAVSRANKQSGDGSTTTTVLTDAILSEGMKTNNTSMDIKHSLEELIPVIDEKIEAQKKTITVDEVSAVASISAEDSELGQTLQKIYQEIGKDGIISLETSGNAITYYEIKEGVRFETKTGDLVDYMANTPKGVIYENPTILVVKNKINTIDDLIPFLKDCQSQPNWKWELVIFCDDIEPKVVGQLIHNHQKAMGLIPSKPSDLPRYMKCAIVKAPIVWKDFIFEDFAKATGSTIISDMGGISFKDASYAHAGTCNKIIVEKNEVTLLGVSDVSEHIANLKEKGDDDSIRRVCWLGTKAAVLKLGANSETELSYKIPKAEDAIHASRIALEDGVVAGGGVCLLNIANEMPNTIGGNILREALKKPIQQIIANAGQVYIEDSNIGGTIGFNAKTREVVDMFEAQIIDPAKVTKNAIRNAISVAGTALTLRGGVTKNRTDEEIAKRFISKQQQW